MLGLLIETIVGRYERHRHYIFDNVTGSEYHFGANQYGSFSKRWELGWDGHYHEKKSTTGDYYYSPMSEEELKENKARQKKLDQQENARQQKLIQQEKIKDLNPIPPGEYPGLHGEVVVLGDLKKDLHGKTRYQLSQVVGREPSGGGTSKYATFYYYGLFVDKKTGKMFNVITLRSNKFNRTTEVECVFRDDNGNILKDGKLIEMKLDKEGGAPVFQ